MWPPACRRHHTGRTLHRSAFDLPGEKRDRLTPRADHVGSLLRPAASRGASPARAGRDPEAELAAAENARSNIIRRQADLGLRSATDGEFRRAMWHFDFLQGLDGVESFRSDHGIASSGIETQAKGLRVTGKVGFSTHPMLDHFRFLREHTHATAKMTIPSPSVLHFRGGRRAVNPEVYPDMQEFYRDLGLAYRGAVHAFAANGCRYLQLDEVNLAYLCDPEQRQFLRERGDDPEGLPAIYAKMINTAISGRPPDMTITMHLCRGNFRPVGRSGRLRAGGRTSVQPDGVDGYFMEFDTERRRLEPLRFVPRANRRLGLVTSKPARLNPRNWSGGSPTQETRGHRKLCLSPQRFASTEEGNALTEDEQWAKLARIVEVARRVWGE